MRKLDWHPPDELPLRVVLPPIGITFAALIMTRTALYFDVTNLFCCCLFKWSADCRWSPRHATHPDHPVGGIAWAQGRVCTGVLAGIKQSVERLMNRYVGHALDYTAPGSTGAIYRC